MSEEGVENVGVDLRAQAGGENTVVIDVGSAAPDARKRGWWSRGE